MSFTAVLVVESARPEDGRTRNPSRVAALEHVANRPIVHHVLDGLVSPCVNQVIVTGEAAVLADMRACVEDYHFPFDRIEYVVCRDGAGLASTLNAVAPLVGDSPCLIHPADGLLDPPVLPLMELLDKGTPDLVVLRAGDRHRTACCDGGALPGPWSPLRGACGGIVEIGMFAARALCGATSAVLRIAGADLATTAEHLAASGASVRVHRVDGWYRYRGHGLDLLELNRIALDRLMIDFPAECQDTNRLEGRVLIDSSAEIRDSVIIGPTVIGPNATVRDAYIGPYTSVGAGARIEGVEIERSIIAPGANVLHIGVRLESSLVGRDARVFRDFSLPRALRLWVSEGDQVALC